MKRVARAWVIAVAALLTASGSKAGAQVDARRDTPPAQEKPPRWPARSRTPIVLMVSPTAIGKPALAYGLLPGPEETEKGNGALRFLDAMSQMPQLNPDEVTLLDAARNDAPLAELKDNDAQLKGIREKFSMSLKLLREGARMESVDWGTGAAIRQQGFQALFPSLGKVRQMAGALALEIRFDIQKHDWAAARDKLETGYKLAHSLATGETVIEALVGLALAGLMDRCVEEWVSEPGAPNLYWPLANLPAPFADMSKALGFERGMAYFSFPEFRDIKAGRYSPELWTGLASRIAEASGMVGGAPVVGGPGAEPWKNHVVATAFGIALYPQAKQYFREKGMSGEAAEKMPVAEAIERYFVQTYDAEADEVFKWKGLPYYEAARGMGEADKTIGARPVTEGNLLARIFLPSLGRAMTVATRGDRQIAMLRVVEAIRAYAAEKGTLPGKLEELTQPVPKDPTTGEPFDYSVNGEAAILNSPSGEQNGGLRYEIRLRK